MDEVPVANANPVNTIVKKNEKASGSKKVSPIAVSLKNLVYMFPLAFVVFLQMFFLGKSFGTFSTLPYASFSSFVFLASLAVFLFFLQLLKRSIVYSTLGGIILVSGIFYAWFGDFHNIILANLQNVGTIVKSAWTRKDIPFPLLMAGIMTFSIAGIAFIQFFVSLFVKSFFETFFGKEWGDGRWMAFAGAIALLAGLQIGFYFYASSAGNPENRKQWELLQKYKPVEKFLTTTPGALMIGKNRIFSSHNLKARAVSVDNGSIVVEKNLVSTVIRNEIQSTESPVFFNDKEIVCFNNEMNLENWRTAYPASFTGLIVKEGENPEIDYKPLTAFYINKGNSLLVYYNYGFIGLYEVASGRNLWLESVDRQAPARKIFADDFPQMAFFHETADRIIFSCQNGLVKALNKETGKEIWNYSHDNPKFNGKPQRGFLTAAEDKVLVSFKTGEMITLALENGRVIYRGKNDAFSFKMPPAFDGLNARFITEEGFYYDVEVDGGRIGFQHNLLPKRLDFLPVVGDANRGIFAHRGEVVKVEGHKVTTLIELGSKVFVTRPVFDEKMMYIGTQDGWIFCIHSGSQHEKFRIHVNGELEENSLVILGNRLLVKTRSGSLISVDRHF